MTFNWWTFLFEVLNFIVLAYVLHRLLYRPLREAIDRRREATARAEAEAQKARQEAEVLQKELEKQLAALEQKRQEAIHHAREQGENERKKLLADAEVVLQQRREEARQILEQEHREALVAVRGEVVGQAFELARRLLSEATDQSLHRQLALRLVRALEEVPEAERELLRAHLRADDGALLETAQELDGSTLEQIGKAVTVLVGKPVSLAVTTRPALLGGIRLRVGGQVWDGSVSGQLQDTMKDVTS